MAGMAGMPGRAAARRLGGGEAGRPWERVRAIAVKLVQKVHAPFSDC